MSTSHIINGTVTPTPPDVSTKNSMLIALLCSLYAIMSLFILFQLTRIYYYRHNKRSFQIFYLAVTFLWALSRSLLFGIKLCCLWPVILYRIFFVIPLCSQYASISLLMLYYATQILRKTPAAHAMDLSGPGKLLKRRRTYFAVCVISNVIFLSVNLAFTAFEYDSNVERSHIIVRVVVTESFFIILTMVFVMLVYKIIKMRTAGILLEAKNTSVMTAVVIAFSMVIIFMSRAIYNLVILAEYPNVTPWGYWPADDDKFVSAYLSLFLSLLFWEILPTFVGVWFFHVKKPKSVSEYLIINSGCNGENDTGVIPKISFFNNPNRYDSDDDNEADDIVGHLSHEPYISTSSLPYNIHSDSSHHGSLLRSSWGSSSRNGSLGTLSQRGYDSFQSYAHLGHSSVSSENV